MATSVSQSEASQAGLRTDTSFCIASNLATFTKIATRRHKNGDENEVFTSKVKGIVKPLRFLYVLWWLNDSYEPQMLVSVHSATSCNQKHIRGSEISREVRFHGKYDVGNVSCRLWNKESVRNRGKTQTTERTVELCKRDEERGRGERARKRGRDEGKERSL